MGRILTRRAADKGTMLIAQQPYGTMGLIHVVSMCGSLLEFGPHTEWKKPLLHGTYVMSVPCIMR